MKNKVLVTGAAGFIGHHLVKKLWEMGYWVIGYDDFSAGKEMWKVLCNEFRAKDIGWIQIKELTGIKYIFHLAAKTKVPYSIEHPHETHEYNVNRTLTLLDMAYKAGVEKFIYASSSAVYGYQEEFPFKESMKPNPISPYGAQKLMAEYYCEIWRKVYDFPTISLRLFNVFGEEQPEDNPYTGVITKFLKQKKDDIPLEIHGTGEQRRDFTYVDDVVEAFIIAADSPFEGVFNICREENISINELANLIGGERIYKEKRKGDIEITLGDVSLFREATGWQAKVDVKEWIKKQVGYGNHIQIG